MRFELTKEQYDSALAQIEDNASFETSRKIAKSGKRLPEMTQAMSLKPGLLNIMDNVGRVIYPGGKLDPVLAEKIIILISELNSCQFCAGIHTDEIVKGLGVNSSEKTTPTNDREKAALAYAKQVTIDANKIPDEMFDALKDHFSDEEIVEITFHASFMNCLNRFNNALRVTYNDDYPES
ncbi:MAG: hypothetical protein COB53_10095 [Elusimicrobia bacterium]|nr:MAG: hypothetical protein COB53_10095 [Elusimicrobiota bacterium]